MADVATLGIVVDATGAVQNLGSLNTALDKTGKAAEQTNARLSLTTEQQKQLQREVQQSTRVLSQLAAVTNKHDADAVRGLKQLIEEQKAWALSVGASAEQLLKLQAIQNGFDKSTQTSIQGLGRITQGFEHLASSAVGLNPVLGRVAVGLAEFGISAGTTVGILAGIAAIGFAYEKLTEQSRKLAKATDEAIDRLKKLKQEQQGSTSGLDSDLALADARIAEARRKLRSAQSTNTSLQSGLNPFGAAFGSGAVSGGVAETQAIRDANAEIAAGERERQRIIDDGAKKVQQSLTADLANLISHNRASAKQRADALALLRAYQSDVDRLSPTDLHGRSELTNQIETLNNALFPKQKVDEAGHRISEMLRRVIDETKGIDLSALLGNINLKTSGLPTNENLFNHPQISPGGGMTDDELKKVFSDFHKGQSERRDQALSDEQKAHEKSAKAAEKHAAAVGKAAQTISQAIEYYLVSKIGGGGVGASLGAAVGKGAVAELGGFGGTALGQAVFGPIGAGLGAAVGGIIDKLDLFGTHAAAVARQLIEMQKALKESVAAFKAQAQGAPSLTDQIQAIHDNANALRDAANAAHPGDLDHSQNTFFPTVKPGSELEKIYQQIAASEAAYIERLKEEARVKNQQFKEDLQVRLLRAQGREKEADQLALKQQQARELAALDEQIKLGLADEATRALLLQVQAAELLKKTVDALTTSVRNAPSGFKIDSYIYQFARPKPSERGWEGTLPPPKPFPTSSANTGNVTYNVTGPVYIDAKTKTPKQAFNEWSREFKQLRTTTTGLNDDPATALSFLPE